MNIKYLWLKLKTKNNWGSGLAYANTTKREKLERFRLTHMLILIAGCLTILILWFHKERIIFAVLYISGSGVFLRSCA